MNKKINYGENSVEKIKRLDVTEIQKRMATLSFLSREQIKIRKYQASIDFFDKTEFV